jgi:hypothetical protein
MTDGCPTVGAATDDVGSDGWAPELAAAASGGRWAAADEHHVHIWSGQRLERSVDRPALLGGGPPRFLAEGTLLVGRYAVDPDTGAATERVPMDAVVTAFDHRADGDRLAVRAVAWTADGARALLFAQYPPTRVKGASDDVRPGGMLALVSTGLPDVRVLDRGRFLDSGRLAGDRWLCAGGRGLRAFDPVSGDAVLSVEPDIGVTAVVTVGDVVVAGLASGEIVRVDVPEPDRLLRWPRHEAAVDAVALSPDGGLIASGDRNGHLTVWRADGTDPLLDTTVPGRVDGVCFLSGEHLVVAVGGPSRQLRHLSLNGER